MKVAIQGSRDFDDYAVFIRSMGVALSPLKEKPQALEIYSAGPFKVNNFLAGFVNLTENDMKSRGMSIKYYKVGLRWLEDNISAIDYFIYLAKPKQPASALAVLADKKDVEVGIFQY